MSISISTVGTVPSPVPSSDHWDNSGLRARLAGQSNPGAAFVEELQSTIVEREEASAPARTSRRDKHRAKRH